MRKAVILRALRRRAVACEVREANPVRMRRVEVALATSPAEEHLRVGPHERDRDLSARQSILRWMTGHTASPAAFAESISAFQRRLNSFVIAGAHALFSFFF